MKKLKKAVALLLSILMIFTLFSTSMTAFAREEPVESGNCGDDASYTLGFYTHKLEITGSGKINAYSFRGRDDVWELEINGEIEEIGEYAFEGCENLKSIYIESNDLTVIGQRAFAYSGLTEVILPSCVETIGSEAFSCCFELEKFHVSDTVTTIGKNTFYGCYGLGRITVDENNAVYDSRNDCNAIIITSSDTLLTGCKTTVIPGDTESLATGSFFNCLDLEEIVIPEGVKIISDYAFCYCLKLKKITLPGSLERVGKDVFPYCMSLEELIIPESVIEIAVEGFSGCMSLKKIVNYSDTAAVFLPIYEDMYDIFSKNAPLTLQQYIDANYFISKYYPRIDPEADTLSAEGLASLEDYTGLHFDSSAELDEALEQCREDGFPSELEIFCKEKSYQHDILVKNKFKHNIIAVTQGITYKDCDLKCSKHLEIFKNEDIAPNCVTVGYKGGTVCLVCAEKDDEERIAASVIEPAHPYGEIQPHTPVLLPGDEPTCSRPGYSDFTACAICGAVLVEPELVPPTDHIDEDGDGLCDYCEMPVGEKPESKTFIEIIAEFLANAFSRILSIFKKIFG